MTLLARSVPTVIAAFTAASALAVVGLPASADSGTDGNNALTEQRWRLPDHYTRAAVQALSDHEVVVSGLDNPRQLVWSNRGHLRIAEAGHGSYKPENCVSGGPEGVRWTGLESGMGPP